MPGMGIEGAALATVCARAFEVVMVVAFILTLDEFVKIPVVYRHYMKYEWVKDITR